MALAVILADCSTGEDPVTYPEYLAKLTASDRAAGDQFGVSAAIGGDCIVVGAHGDEGYTGSAYVFQLIDGAWTQAAKLTASDGAAGDMFGYSVAIDGDCALVGTDQDSEHPGSAYAFIKPSGGWEDATETAELTASDGSNGDSFGIAVTLSGEYALVGANCDDSNTGSAYAWRLY